MNAEIPADAGCTGTVAGQSDVCLMKCMNGAKAGPFGGVVPMQMASPNNTAAAARRALANVVRDTTLELNAMKAKRADIQAEAEDDDEE